MCCRELGALVTSRSLAEPRTPDDWQTLVEAAVRERVAAAIAPIVHDDATVPEAVRRALSRERYNTGACNLVLYRELARVLAAAPSKPVVLKGGALASTVYGDISLRPMSDLDLLVRTNELDAWTDCLERLGYRPDAPEMAPGLARAVHYQLAFRGGGDGDVVIELHWNLVAGATDWRSPEIEWFWEQTEPWPGIADLECPPALQLTPLASLLYLSAHALLQHGGARTRLIWLYDIHRLLETRRDGIAWERVVEKSRELRWDAAVARALEQCRTHFATDVPEAVVDALGSRSTPASSAHVNVKSVVEPSRAAHVLREIRCLEGAARLRLVLAILFPAPAYLKWRYPWIRPVWPLAYAYRWYIVAREGAAHAARLLTTALSFVSL